MKNSTTATARITLDTNILVYATDSSEGAKHALAGRILLRAAVAHHPLMLQCLNEFANVIRRKRLTSHAILSKIIRYHTDSFPIEAPSVEDLFEALQAQEHHNLPLWDALFWATARRAGCNVILSEDFQDGRELGGVRFVNPFTLSRAALRNLF